MSAFVYKILRHKTIRALWQLIQFVLTLPLYILGYFVPKKPEIWVFSNVYGYQDNARYLFEYVLDQHPEITPVWIMSWGGNSLGVSNCYSRFSFIGLWLQYRACIAFVSTGKGDLARFTLSGKKIIQLWHGIPIKRILLDSPESLPFGNRSGKVHAVCLKLFRRSLKRYDFVIASSESVQRRLMSAFGLPKERVVITGYPRHDVLLANSTTIKKRILYAPTWRSDIQTALSIIQPVCSTQFVSKINELGYELWVSIHPLNNELTTMLDSNILNSINLIENEDINIVLANSKVLITDYSSIALDFALLNRKTIFYTPDALEYFESRGVYEEFEKIIMNKGVKSEDGILTHLLDEEEYFDYSLGNQLFKYHDSGARERIVNLGRSIV